MTCVHKCAALALTKAKLAIDKSNFSWFSKDQMKFDSSMATPAWQNLIVRMKLKIFIRSAAAANRLQCWSVYSDSREVPTLWIRESVWIGPLADSSMASLTILHQTQTCHWSLNIFSNMEAKRERGHWTKISFSTAVEFVDLLKANRLFT